MYCSNCGATLAAGVNFCPNCGTKVAVPVVNTASLGNMVMLVSVGSSNRTTAAALLVRLCGYSSEEALLIVDCAPITIARGLGDAQARYLAQALSEYGIEVSVYDGNGWREWESDTGSVWDQTGALLAGVASALGLMGIGNRITRDMIRRSDYPYRTTGSRPPVFRLNSSLRTAVRPPVHRNPPPARPMARPTPQPAPRPAPAARPAPQPAPRPAPAARPAPQPAPRPAPAARPAPQPTPRPTPAARPGGPVARPGEAPAHNVPGNGHPGGRPGGGTGRRG